MPYYRRKNESNPNVGRFTSPVPTRGSTGTRRRSTGLTRRFPRASNTYPMSARSPQGRILGTIIVNHQGTNASPKNSGATKGQIMSLTNLAGQQTTASMTSFPNTTASNMIVTPGGSANDTEKILLTQKIIRDTYKQCLAQAASSGKYLTSVQRQSLLTAISTEAVLQQQPGQQDSPPVSGLPQSPNPSMTTDELVSLLRQKLSISASGSPPTIPSSAINI